MAKLAASRYAEALFKLAIEENKVDTVYDDILAIQLAFESDEDFKNVINHPRISYDEKMRLITSIAGADSEFVLGLFSVVLRKSREEEIPGIISAFIENVREYRGVTLAIITSAFELSSVQVSTIKDLLTKNLNKQVEVETRVDPGLIGGLYIKVDGRIIDYSLKTRINDLKTRLLNLPLAQ